MPSSAWPPRVVAGAGAVGRSEKKSATCEWPISATRSACIVDALGGLLDREHVLPDRVAGGGVEEADLVLGVRRAPARRKSSVSGSDVLPRSTRRRPRRPPRRRRVSSSPSTARSWLPTRQTSQRSRDQRRAGVGLGAVADDVAEAPALLDAGLVDRREHGLEGGQVASGCR